MYKNKAVLKIKLDGKLDNEKFGESFYLLTKKMKEEKQKTGDV